jgi:hypothetical protein
MTTGTPAFNPVIAWLACALFAEATTSKSKSNSRSCSIFSTTPTAGKSDSAAFFLSGFLVSTPTTSKPTPFRSGAWK